MPTFYSESDLPLAAQDITVTQTIEHGVEVQRKLFAGQRVPADLIDAYHAVEGGSTPADATDYSKMTVAELQALADERSLEVQGSGNDGNVVKADLVEAHDAHDAAV